MTRVAEQMAERRDRILDAARELIAEHGFEGLTIRELAHEAGVTAPTIYNLIGSKDEVLVAAVAEQTERFLQGIRRAPGDVLPIVDANLRELLRMPRYYRSLLRLMITSEAAAPARRTVTLAMGGQLHDALVELSEAGGLHEWVDVDALNRQIQATLWGISLLWAEGIIDDAVFAAQERYGVALLMLGVTRAGARDVYARAARKHQAVGRSRSGSKVTALRSRR